MPGKVKPTKGKKNLDTKKIRAENTRQMMMDIMCLCLNSKVELATEIHPKFLEKACSRCARNRRTLQKCMKVFGGLSFALLWPRHQRISLLHHSVSSGEASPGRLAQIWVNLIHSSSAEVSPAVRSISGESFNLRFKVVGSWISRCVGCICRGGVRMMRILNHYIESSECIAVWLVAFPRKASVCT